ncbi:hypothetical protein XELAEV_18038406mg [Xenopus laevis]|uniref:Uncharacterized protein n=1 Tax=Xenopus laevis TaxID=8355 RepID=A0A974C5N9_XENLA|nr:hypothetical protein XELAEV_18038406mg [Xenopus laevis]
MIYLPPKMCPVSVDKIKCCRPDRQCWSQKIKQTRAANLALLLYYIPVKHKHRIKGTNAGFECGDSAPVRGTQEPPPSSFF